MEMYSNRMERLLLAAAGCTAGILGCILILLAIVFA